MTEWLDESQHWPEIPATFKSRSDYEDKSAALRDWSPSIITGLLQTEDYTRTLLSVQDISTDTLAVRLANRMERQQRVLGKEIPPTARFIVDELSLYREVGSPDVMAAQLHHLLEMAATPKITIQVLPAIAHPANAAGFLLTGDAARVEHATAGYVFTDAETLTELSSRFDMLRGERYRVSESLALIERLAEVWATGASPRGRRSRPRSRGKATARSFLRDVVCIEYWTCLKDQIPARSIRRSLPNWYPYGSDCASSSDVPFAPSVESSNSRTRLGR